MNPAKCMYRDQDEEKVGWVFRMDAPTRLRAAFRSRWGSRAGIPLRRGTSRGPDLS